MSPPLPRPRHVRAESPTWVLLWHRLHRTRGQEKEPNRAACLANNENNNSAIKINPKSGAEPRARGSRERPSSLLGQRHTPRPSEREYDQRELCLRRPDRDRHRPGGQTCTSAPASSPSLRLGQRRVHVHSCTTQDGSQVPGFQLVYLRSTKVS